MSVFEEFEEVDISDEPVQTCNSARSKKFKPQKKTKIPNLEGSFLHSATYDYEKLMSLVSSNKVKSSNIIESKKNNSCQVLKNKNEVADRLLNYQQLSDNRTRFKKIEQEFKEMEDCTFSPKINNNNPKRNFTKFLEHQNDFQKIKRTKLDKKKIILCKEKQINDLSPKIEISPGSQKINGLKKELKTVHERLYQDSRTCKKSQSVLNNELVKSYSPDFVLNKNRIIKKILSTEACSTQSIGNLVLKK